VYVKKNMRTVMDNLHRKAVKKLITSSLQFFIKTKSSKTINKLTNNQLKIDTDFNDITIQTMTSTIFVITYFVIYNIMYSGILICLTCYIVYYIYKFY